MARSSMINNSATIVKFYIDFTHGKEEYEYRYIRIVSVPTHYWEDQKFFKVRDVTEVDIGENKHNFKEINFTVIIGKRSYKMMKIGRIEEKMEKGEDLNGESRLTRPV